MSSFATEPHAKGEFGEPLPRPTATSPGLAYYTRKVLKPLASLQLTIVLFVLGIVLIFFGTMAQREFGIWTVVDKYFWSWYVMVPFDLINKFLNIFWKEAFPEGSTWGGSFPLPAGKLIGGLMLANLLAAHALRFRLSWKRAGILLIHSGLVLLFVGEYITREHTIEQRMTIEEGKSANFAEDSRFVELVFVNSSHPDHDQVVTIPEAMLKEGGGIITHDNLPVNVEVVGKFMVNSALERPKPGQYNPADSGLGEMWTAKDIPEVSGVDEQKVNLPAVYVRVSRKDNGKLIGTYLTSLQATLLGGADTIVIDDTKLHMSLRFKRYYKPYSIHLDKFSFDRYTGTNKARNFSSDVRVYDESGNFVFTRTIRMNEPMRYNGETFYQQGHDRAEITTILQVVTKPGWVDFWLFEVTIDYIACAVVALGLTVHFLIYLIQFLVRLKPPTETALSGFVKYFPWFVIGMAVLYLIAAVWRMDPPTKPMDLEAAGRMPVVEGGRVKPLDTVARVKLRMISGTEEFVDENGKKQPAIRWYMDAISATPERPGPAWKHQFIRIDNEQVLRALELKERSGFRYSMDELQPKLDIIQKKMKELEKKVNDGKKLDLDDTKFKELRDRIQTYMEIISLGGPLMLPPQTPEDSWGSLYEVRSEAEMAALNLAMTETRTQILPKLSRLTPQDEARLFLSLGMKLEDLPPDERTRARERIRELLAADPVRIPDPPMREFWLKAAFQLLDTETARSIQEMRRTEYSRRVAEHPAAVTWDNLISAYRENRANDFARAVEDYNTIHAAHVRDKNTRNNLLEWVIYPPFDLLGRNTVEILFNRIAPFYKCAVFYVMAFLLAIIGFTQYAAQRPHWGAALRRSAFYLLIFTLIGHTIALFTRMYILERPMVFVTNLYSSAIFIGWGCVALCLVIERIFPIGVGNLLAAILGLTTTIVAHNIANDDTLEMLVAVLDTNFWLATHVTTVTLGYTATFVAGKLGALYVLQMLGAVVRDSFKKRGEPTVGELLAFSVAVFFGIIGIPLFFIWFMVSAMVKFELLPSPVLWGGFGLIAAVSVVYGIALTLQRVASPGVDERGKPIDGQLPTIAKPIAALALTPERAKIFGQMVYGVVCFATLLSFVGTVLGGIWADQSWGRFWGWDPKENGAVLIVLWNALILHARWAGLVKDRGIAVLAIFGNIITAWSWFGTNQLSIGLHAYGFDTRLADGCFNYWLSQMLILAVGLIPQRFWAGATRRPRATVPGDTPSNLNAQQPPNGTVSDSTDPAAPPPGNRRGPRRDGPSRDRKP